MKQRASALRAGAPSFEDKHEAAEAETLLPVLPDVETADAGSDAPLSPVSSTAAHAARLGGSPRRQRRTWEQWFEMLVVRYTGPTAVVGLAMGTCTLTRMFLTPRIAHLWYAHALEDARTALAAIGLCFLAAVNSVDPGSLELWDSADGRPEVIDDLPAGQHDYDEMSVAGERVGEEEIYRWCGSCQMWRPPRCSHCRTCERCFLRYDHHCPWIGNCVAAHNHRFFAAFLFFIGMAGVTVPISAWLAWFELQQRALHGAPVGAAGGEDGPSGMAHPGALGSTFASNTAALGIVAILSSCYCGVLALFGCASWFMLCADVTTKERFGREHREIDCEDTCEAFATGEWHREMRRLMCAPVRLRRH